MLGKRTVTLTLALGGMLLTGWVGAPVGYRWLVLNPRLAEAVKTSDLDRAEQLVTAGADVNLPVPREFGFSGLPESALALAARMGDADAVRHFVKVGARADLPASGGVTPLMLAAASDQPATLRALLKLGAKVNARDDEGETPLMYAAAHGWASYDGRFSPERRISREPDAIKVLLAAGADSTLEDHRGLTALAKAELAGERKYVAVLRRTQGKGLRDVLAGTPELDLFYAIRTQDIGAVKRQIEHGAHVAVQDADGMSPLAYAAQQFDGTLLHYLLQHAPDVKAALELRGPGGRTVLLQSFPYEYSFHELLKAGADPNTVDDGAHTAFEQATPKERKWLLEAGGKPPPS